MSLSAMETLPQVGKRWLLRFDKGRSALQQRFRSLTASVVRDVSIQLPMGAHRSYWAGVNSDSDLIEFLARSLADDGLFLDIGANIGVYSAALWKMRGAMRGVAFEPVATTQALLESTFQLNQVPFSIERMAISDKQGVLRLTAYANGMNNFWVTPDDDQHPVVEVPTFPLDTWCNGDPQRIPGALKIDVEGHELAVLQGGRKTLRAHRPALVMECHAAAWEGLGVSREELDAEVRAIGYRRVCDRLGRPVDFLRAQDTFHMLGIP